MRILRYIKSLFKKRELSVYEKFIISKADFNKIDIKELTGTGKVVFIKQNKL